VTLDYKVPEPRAFLARYGILIGCGVCVMAMLAGFRVWRDYQAKQPVLEQHQQALEQLAETSTQANSMLQRYYVDHKRSTVASEDFMSLCTLMYREANLQGTHPELLSWNAVSPGPTSSTLKGCASKVRW
jgi:hypothetical protein